ncbi:unnamed protein product [Caenorhabditis bovis]|uniref:Uncharacterized protein n=1 Tax=Caenorhabditis bovis TaxID=2654633 RepID=A0A8S1ET30_9PELO|nr:unnamed protein product [Caenorhabditis bovis]
MVSAHLMLYLIGLTGTFQLISGVFTHSGLLQMSMASSLFSLICLIEKMGQYQSSGTTLLFRAGALVVYIAMLFINFSHCLEEISDFGNLQVSSNETSGDHTHGRVNQSLMIILLSISSNACDFIFKSVFCFFIPPMAIQAAWKNFIVLALPSISIIAIFVFEKLCDHDVLDLWVSHHLDPLIAVVLTLISYSIIIPSLICLKPYLLADNPPLTQFDISAIESTLKQELPSLVNFSHVHASLEWPKSFKVTMKAQLKISKTDPTWVSKAADSFKACKERVHDLVKKAGANKVVVEPIFVDPEEDLDERNQTICIDRRCHANDVGCCTVRQQSTVIP